MRRIILWFQRLLVFALGAVTVWLIAFVFLDLDERHRIPWFVALALSYGIAAYVILPHAIRIGLRILHRGRVPSYTLTGDGLPGDPVNLVLVGTMLELRGAFAATGWSQADKLDLASSARMAFAFVFGRSYSTAPFSTLYLFGRGQDIGFQKAIDNSPRKRHHVRFWGMPFARPEAALDTPQFWLNSGRPTDDERVLWVGAGTKDIGFSLTWLSFQVTHATDADTNAERDFLVAELLGHGVIRDVRSHRPGERIAIGHVNRYITDGEVAMAEIAPLPSSRGA